MLPTNVRLDPYTTYSIIMNEIENRSRVIFNIDRIMESDDPTETIIYTRKDLIKYWITKNNEDIYLKTISNRDHDKCFIIDKINGYICIPLTNKDKNIINYTITNLSYLNEITKYGFYMISAKPNRKYVKTRESQSMHEIIFGMKADIGYVIDHKNSDGLDNRIENLCMITKRENSANVTTSNKIIGTMWRPKRNKWKAAMKINGKCHYLGSFDNQIDAAKQYDKISVYLYPGVKQLNQLNGIPLLTSEEIEEVKNNPQKYDDILYHRKRKNINIRETSFGTFTHYKDVTKKFPFKENADEYLKIFKCRLEEYKIKALSTTDIQFKDDYYFFSVKISKNFKTFEKA